MVSPHVGAFIVLNSAGWILTANHILKAMGAQKAAKDAADAHAAGKTAAEPLPNVKDRSRALKALGHLSPTHTRDFSVWWSWDGVQAKTYHELDAADLAIVQLEPFDQAWIASYPTMKDPPKSVLPGTSVVRAG